MNNLMQLQFNPQAVISVPGLSPATVILSTLLILGCSGGSDNDSADSGTAGESNSQVDNTETWLINSSAVQSDFIFDPASNQGELPNVQNTLLEINNDVEYLRVVTKGIPDYQVTMTQPLINLLNTRTEATTDFVERCR